MDRKGPNPETLKSLAGMLPHLANGILEGKVGGKGRSIAPEKRPRKLCTICLARYDFATMGEDFLPTSGICDRCQGLLDDGYIAFVCGGEVAFAKHPHLADMAGTIQKINSETFEKIRNKLAVKTEPPEGA
jgi:hypothetical protein